MSNMGKFLSLLQLMVLFGCGSGGNTNAPAQINTVKTAPKIEISNITPNSGTGHRAGEELTLLSFTVENVDPTHQILRNVIWALYNSSGELVDSFSSIEDFGVIDLGMVSGGTFASYRCVAEIIKIHASGKFTIEAYAIDVDGVKSNKATASLIWP